MTRYKNLKTDQALFTTDTIKIAERGVLVTMSCYVNDVGHPSFIFPILTYRDHMMEGAPNGSLVLVTPSGWMNSELFPEVFKHFIKYMNVSKNNPVVLVMDKHESHLRLLNYRHSKGERAFFPNVTISLQTQITTNRCEYVYVTTTARATIGC